jgi:hypothetical protein
MKRAILMIIIGISLIIINQVSAINLEVTSEPISSSVIPDINKPAEFNINIKNLEETDDFLIYSLVGIDIFPNAPVRIEEGVTKTIKITAMPRDSLINKDETIPFEYLIKNSKNEIQSESLVLTVISLKNSFSITTEPIDTKSEYLIVNIKNNANYDFDNIKLKLTSAFFDEFTDDFALKSLENKDFEIPLDREKIKQTRAGQYLLTSELIFDEHSIKSESIIGFIESSDLIETTDKQGIIINKKTISKKNTGNTIQAATILVKKNLFSYLFTTVNPLPKKSYNSGIYRVYVWEKDLNPNEELTATITTNWLYPIAIIALIIFLFYLIKRSLEKDIIFTKKVSYVRTKGGEFALRVSLNIKSKKNIEKINIIDRLPHLVKLYEKFGAIAPDKVDMHNKRLEWNIGSMRTGEEKIFSYIIYSHKIGVVGRFELPSARIVYERSGRIRETTSNRAFFINEPKQG